MKMNNNTHKRIPLTDHCPDMVNEEWHWTYNRIMGSEPATTSKDSVKAVYWKCPKCGAVYRMSPRKKLEQKERNKTSCFACRGRVQIHAFTV